MAADENPDGYVVILKDPSSPVGYWIVAGYTKRETAEKVSGDVMGKTEVKAVKFIDE